ncbi:UDP-glucose 4-epimerase [Candidatus Protofrankia californiensis]|uniref:UDP-glucose 4-epimerase n=1 Tax=Candidatus Protofrankia californiensis TaxID=1839754 RepID=A0A1C3NTF2_9ACTN|nr:UDP-glucose 4-epimerase [Candidatus Protofrankia californiensis]
MFEDGGQLRDFVHVHDVAQANLHALRYQGAPGELIPLNIGSGDPHTVGDMASVLAQAFGGPMHVVTGSYRAGDVRHVAASSARARDFLGYQPRVAFSDGVNAFARDPLRS